MFLLNKSKSKVSSRNQLQIKEVKDAILILPKHEYRVVLETSSVNFELKSEEEQDALLDNFQNFLNSLPCQLQILVRVREIDIDHYVEEIKMRKEQETEKIYKEQIDNYSSFITSLVSGNKILTRRFYIIIPYMDQEHTKDFSLIKEQITLQKDIVQKGIEKLGMKATQLDSLELLNLFYAFYNPRLTKTQALKGQTVKMLLANTYA